MVEVLRCENVGVRRGEKMILDDVSWVVNEGEHWVVLGPSGAGKATLVQLAAGRLHPTTGHVQVLGERQGAVDVFELRPRIGFSSAAHADEIPPRGRVLDIVRTDAYGMTRTWREAADEADEQRAPGRVHTFSGAGLAGRASGSLSGGQRKGV